MRNTNRKLLLLTTVLATAGMAASGQAETAAESGSKLVLDEIVVTAQKREQGLQDVPVSVSAFGSDFMKKAKVEDIRGLVDLTPGFNGKTEDSFGDALAIRGISTNDFGVGGDPSVAVFVDGFYQGRNGGIQTSYFDMERAEVVKGPQGTLFGRNAIAGAISVFTRKPDENLGGSVQLGVGSRSHMEMTAVANVPLSDNVYVRFAGRHVKEDGYLENLVDGEKLGDKAFDAVRMGLRYEGEKTDITLRLNYEDRDQAPSVYRAVGLTIPEDKVETDLSEDGVDQSEIFSATLDMEFDLNETWTLTSLSGFKTFDFFYYEDFDGTGQMANNYIQDNEVDYYSQELRLNYDGGGSIVGFLGASVYKEEIKSRIGNERRDNDLCAAIIATDFQDVATTCAEAHAIDVNDEYGFPDVSSDLVVTETNLNNGDYTGFAIYGDVTWSATKDLDITVGARYTRDKKEFETSFLQTDGPLGNFFNLPFATDGFVRDDQTWSGFTPRAAINYHLNDNISLYANISRGYKSGGYATFALDLSETGVTEDDIVGGIVPDGAKPRSFDEETVWSYELGAKTKLFDNRMQLNLSLYRYDYTDLQLSYFEVAQPLVDNVGEARGQGVELDVRALPLENLDVYFTLAYADTEIIDATELLDLGVCEDCEGNALPYSPEWSTSLIVTYTVPVASGAFYGTLEHHYQSKAYSGVDNIENVVVDGWDEVTLRLGYENDGQSWRIAAYVENVFDEVYFERGWENADKNNEFGFGLQNILVWPSRPRTFGVDFSMDF